MSALLGTIAQIAVLVGLVVAVAYYLKLDPIVTKVALGVGIFAVFVVTIINFVRRLRIPKGRPADPAKAARKQAKRQLWEEAKVLRVRFRELVRYLRRGQDGLGVRYSEARDRRAWWVVIGAQGHGKSTLLSSAPDVEEIAGAEAEGPRFFVTPAAVFVELPADYDRRPGAALAFPTFLRALRRLRREQPIDGVLLVHRVDALLANDAGSTLVADARRQIDRLAKGLDVQVPVIVAGSQLDALPGLAELCADTEHVDPSRALGIALPARLTGQATAETASAHFDASGGPVEWVRDRCFTLVASSEDGHRSQARLFGFWQSFGKLGGRAADVVGLLSAARLPGGDPLPLRGIYFTAAGTGGYANAVDPCLASMAREVGGALTGGGSSGSPGVFTSDFLAHELRRAGGYGRRSLPYRRRRVMLHALGATLVLSLGVYMAVGMTASAEGNIRLLQTTSERAYAVEQSGARIPEAGELRSYASLLESVDDWSGSRPEGLGWGLFRSDLVKDAVIGTARAAVCRGVVAPAVVAVESELDKFVGAFAEGGMPGGERRSDVLAWLRFYLMLSEGDDMACLPPPDPWSEKSARGEITKIIGMQGAHLKPLLESYADTVGPHFRDIDPGRAPDVCVRSHGAQAIVRRESLVESVREILNRESGERQLVDDLIATINKDETPFKLATNSGRVKSRHRQQVAPAFTKKGWLEFSELLSRRLGRSAAGDGWALCRAGVGSAEERCELAADMYVAQYEDAWREFVDGVWIDSPSSISEAIAIYRDLLREAPLERFWKAVDRNTRGLAPIRCMAPGSVGPEEDSLVGKILASVELHRSSTHGAGDPTMQHAREIEAEFRGFSSFGVPSGDGAEASVTALSKYHKRLGELRAAADQANQNREQHEELVGAMDVALGDIKTSLRNEPLDGWDGEVKALLMPPLESLSVVIDSDRARRLNEMWCEEVVKLMRRSLADKYPFNAQARMRGKLDDVDILFHPASGIIAKFRDDKLSAYVEQLGGQVVARELGVDAKYHPSRALIELLNASHQLGTLLFPDEKAEISFDLTMGCTGQMARVELSLDGEVVTYLCGREQAKRITWPGEGDKHEATLVVKGEITGADKGDVYTRPGDFAILELMDRKLSPKRDPGTGLISLSVDAKKNDLGVLRMTVRPDQVPGGGDIFYGFGGETFLAPFRSPRFLNPPTSLFNEVSFTCGGEGSPL